MHDSHSECDTYQLKYENLAGRNFIHGNYVVADDLFQMAGASKCMERTSPNRSDDEVEDLGDCDPETKDLGGCRKKTVAKKPAEKSKNKNVRIMNYL